MSDEELRAVAEAATPGAWAVNTNETGDLGVFAADGTPVVMAAGDFAEDPDLTYVTTFSPPTVLALLNRVQTAEADRKFAESQTVDWMRRYKQAQEHERTAEAELTALRASIEALADHAENTPSARYIHPSHLRALTAPAHVREAEAFPHVDTEPEGLVVYQGDAAAGGGA